VRAGAALFPDDGLTLRDLVEAAWRASDRRRSRAGSEPIRHATSDGVSLSPAARTNGAEAERP
jgi:hypothetical protein